MLLTSYHKIGHVTFYLVFYIAIKQSKIYVFEAPGFKVYLNINEAS